MTDRNDADITRCDYGSYKRLIVAYCVLKCCLGKRPLCCAALRDSFLIDSSHQKDIPRWWWWSSRGTMRIYKEKKKRKLSAGCLIIIDSQKRKKDNSFLHNRSPYGLCRWSSGGAKRIKTSSSSSRERIAQQRHNEPFVLIKQVTLITFPLSLESVPWEPERIFI